MFVLRVSAGDVVQLGEYGAFRVDHKTGGGRMMQISFASSISGIFIRKDGKIPERFVYGLNNSPRTRSYSREELAHAQE